MRLFPTIAAAAFLAATPFVAQVGMAQVVIGGPSRDADRSDYRAEQQREAAHHDMEEARAREAERDQRNAAHERAEAKEHHEGRAEPGGVRLEIGH